MITDGLEHYGDIRIKGDANYLHGYGLKPIARYSDYFFIRERGRLRLFNKKLVETASVPLGNDTGSLYTLFSPSGNRALAMHDAGSQTANRYVELIDVKNREILATINGRRGAGFDILKDGSFLIANDEKVTYYDKSGVLTYQSSVIGRYQYNPVFAHNEKETVNYYANSINGGVYNNDLTELLIADSIVFTSQRNLFTKYSGLVAGGKYQVFDYDNKERLSQTTIAGSMHVLNDDVNGVYYTTNPSNVPGDLMYFSYTGLSSQLIKQAIVSELFVGIDKKHYFTRRGTSLKMYDRNTDELITVVTHSGYNNIYHYGKTNGLGLSFIVYE